MITRIPPEDPEAVRERDRVREPTTIWPGSHGEVVEAGPASGSGGVVRRRPMLEEIDRTWRDEPWYSRRARVAEERSR